MYLPAEHYRLNRWPKSKPWKSILHPSFRDTQTTTRTLPEASNFSVQTVVRSAIYGHGGPDKPRFYRLG